MKASLWLHLTLALGLLSAASLLTAALAPLLIRPAADSKLILPVELDLACLFLPTRADWEVHLVSYALLGLLLGGGGWGGASLVTQLLRTQRAVGRLLLFTRPLDAPLQALLAELQLTDRVDLVQTPVPLAFCYGLLRPRVCLSTGMVAVLTADELAALLWHERYHLLRRDPLKVAVGRAWTAAFFFIPVARALYERYLVAKEVDADRYVCRQQGHSEALASALCVLLELPATLPGGAQPSLTAGAAEALEVRVAGLLGQPQRLSLPLRSAVGSLLLLLLLVGLEWSLAQASVANVLWQLQHTALGGC